MAKRAVVLLSGGLDSATVLAVAKSEGYEIYALTVDYGQRHRREIECARKQGRAQQVAEHRIIRLELPSKDSSVLTSPGDVPAARLQKEVSTIPPTYVPARNTILLALALSWAESVGAEMISRHGRAGRSCRHKSLAGRSLQGSVLCLRSELVLQSLDQGANGDTQSACCGGDDREIVAAERVSQRLPRARCRILMRDRLSVHVLRVPGQTPTPEGAEDADSNRPYPGQG